MFAYYSLLDPVFQSAVLTYFRKISHDSRLRIILLTFEDDRFSITPKAKATWLDKLKEEEIVWKHLKWHSGKLKLVKKAYDLICSLFYGTALIHRYHVHSIYSEGFPGAILGHILAKLNRCRHIVHTYEPHADYMLEGGTWSKQSWEFRLLKSWEKIVGRSADALITATQGYKEEAKSWCGSADKIHVIPSLIDTTQFYRDEKARRQIREQYGVHDHEIVLVYLGKFGGMYMDEELFSFFAQCEKVTNYSFRYWIFTATSEHEVEDRFRTVEIPTEKVRIVRLEHHEVSRNLSACDVGMVAVRPFPSKRYCSPIKTGEYWACGLPILIPKGVSDDYYMVEHEGGGQSLENMFAQEVNWEKLLNCDPQDQMLLAKRYRSLQDSLAYFIQILIEGD